MGQAKRRSAKKSEFKLPEFSFDKVNFSKVKASLLEKMTPLVNRWQKFPVLHRRVLLVLVPVVLVLLILPTTEQLNNDIGVQDTSVRRDIALNITSEEVTTSEEAAQFEEPVEQRVRAITNNIQPLNTVKPKAVVVSPSASVKTTKSSSAISSEWAKHQVQKGETLSNIFREKSLPLSDLYAVAAIEGEGKPLSQIKSGQWLRYKQTPDGKLDALQIESSAGSTMYFRRSDGSFARGK
ncbi:MAG: LysM-like peptidoglycan-binding domain-containing protein [Photobacterium frigidiphilum]|uniref:LysM-like peptidoglycan-binding domain-containing protein n=1 Tax=Photobacterium frigidiphilum TaxID=264736 RepID=UPI003002536B